MGHKASDSNQLDQHNSLPHFRCSCCSNACLSIHPNFGSDSAHPFNARLGLARETSRLARAHNFCLAFRKRDGDIPDLHPPDSSKPLRPRVGLTRSHRLDPSWPNCYHNFGELGDYHDSINNPIALIMSK